MKKVLLSLSVVALLGFNSCKETAKGVTEDAQNATEAVGDAAQTTTKAVGDAAQTTTEAVGDAAQAAADFVTGGATTGNETVDAFLKEYSTAADAYKTAMSSGDKTALEAAQKAFEAVNVKGTEVSAVIASLPADVQTKISEFLAKKAEELSTISPAN